MSLGKLFPPILANTLAYYENSLITDKKGFIISHLAVRFVFLKRQVLFTFKLTIWKYRTDAGYILYYHAQ